MAKALIGVTRRGGGGVQEANDGPSKGRKFAHELNVTTFVAFFILVLCLAYSSALKMESIPPKHRLPLFGLHGVISQNIELFLSKLLKVIFS
jgi:hypothetical protein